MKKLTILVDMDDTIECLLKAWLQTLNSAYGRNVQPDDCKEWNMTVQYPGLTTDQVYAPVITDEFWDAVVPMPGAQEGLKKLIDAGHEIYIVTAHPYETVRAKMERVLFRYFPYITWDQVIITSHKQMLKADVLIDDGIHNHEGADYAKILVDAPYNRDFDAEGNGMVRVHNWDEILAAVAQLAED